MARKCPYCLSKKVTILTGTVYCEYCQSYFRVVHNELVPIFIEDRKVYRKYQKPEERKILCGPCQERNEIELEKNRVEEEQKLKMKRHAPGSRKTSDVQIHSILCRECVTKINEKLEEDKRKYYGPYEQFVRRKRMNCAAVFVLSVLLSWIGSPVVGSALLGLFTVRELRNMQSVGISVVFCGMSLHWSCSVGLFGLFYIYNVFTRRKYKEVEYLQCNIDIDKIQKEIVRRLRDLKIEDKADTEEKENEAHRAKGRSFLHTAYNMHVRNNEEIAEIVKGIANLRIKDKWYGKVDKIVEWLATS